MVTNEAINLIPYSHSLKGVTITGANKALVRTHSVSRKWCHGYLKTKLPCGGEKVSIFFVTGSQYMWVRHAKPKNVDSQIKISKKIYLMEFSTDRLTDDWLIDYVLSTKAATMLASWFCQSLPSFLLVSHPFLLYLKIEKICSTHVIGFSEKLGDHIACITISYAIPSLECYTTYTCLK